MPANALKQITNTIQSRSANEGRRPIERHLVHSADRFQISVFILAPGESTKTLAHFHRVAHCVVVRGSGRITVNDQSVTFYENDLLSIPVGASHSVQNHGKVDLHIIEVFTGAYLDDDALIEAACLSG